MESALYGIHALVVSVSEMSQLVREYPTRPLPCMRYKLIQLFWAFNQSWKKKILNCCLIYILALEANHTGLLCNHYDSTGYLQSACRVKRCPTLFSSN